MLFQVVRSVVPVGEKEVRTLLARMASEKIGRGVLLATSSFTSEAGDLARKKSISLFDGVALKKLLENEGTPSRPTQDGFSDEQEFLETGPQ